MNINKFTQKSIEAVNNCEKIAYDYGNQEIDQEHFLYSLMTIEDSLIANLIEKMDINKDTFIKNIETLLSQKTKVSGNVNLYVSNDLNKVLVNAEDEAKRMGDAYVSVEHLMLAMIAAPNKAVKTALLGAAIIASIRCSTETYASPILFASSSALTRTLFKSLLT